MLQHTQARERYKKYRLQKSVVDMLHRVLIARELVIGPFQDYLQIVARRGFLRRRCKDANT